MTTFDVDYFIAKFEAIPDELWCCEAFERHYAGRPVTHCALGHCGAHQADWDTLEARALSETLSPLGYIVTEINDGGVERFAQDTPRERILAALYLLRSRGW